MEGGRNAASLSLLSLSRSGCVSTHGMGPGFGALAFQML